MLRGIPISLVSKTRIGTDPFNRPVYTETVETVENVLVGQPTAEERLETYNLTGRKVAYTLGIPKGDTHVWEGQDVILPSPYAFAGRYHVVGIPVSGIDELIPLQWNTKVQVERYG